MTAPRMSPSDLPDWPQLIGRKLAAAYCGISEEHFEATVPVKPRRLGARKLWGREALDDGRTGWTMARP
jgi:hypothetical protein